MSPARAPRAFSRAASAFGLLALLLACGACSRTPSAAEERRWDGEIQRLEATQDSLRRRAAELIAQDPVVRSIPRDDVVIAVPTAFVRDVLTRVFTDVASNVTLRLGGLKAHVEKSVKKVVTIGVFTVDVDILEVLGKLKPEPPAAVFGDGRIALTLPVNVASGDGKARIRFVWDGKNVAGMTCGDMDLTREVTGEVVPARYVVHGNLGLKIGPAGVTGVPSFPETRLRLRVTPSRAAWDTVQAILDEKHGVCGWVLDRVDVPKLLANVTESKGFNVKLPLDKIKPFVIPAGVRDSVRVGERMLAVDARTTLLRVDADAIWYGASVDVKGVRVESPPRRSP